jgi:hypothetical protein
MDAQTRRWVAVGLLAAGGGIALLIAARQIAPRVMRKMMLRMRQSMMREMMSGESGFDPPEM